MDSTKKIISLAKRRGFIFPSSEIYDGLAGFYDFGSLGVEMKRNIENHWWRYMQAVENIVGFDSSIILNPSVWKASGHLDKGFADDLVECKSCHRRFKAEDVETDKCGYCGGELTSPRSFNLMMKTFTGPIENDASVAYLRAETCQGIFINFKNIMESQRMKLPFGVIQTGKAFRNEINPGNFIFRMREFEQMEMEWFCAPSKASEWFDFWLNKRLEWYKKLGFNSKNIKTVEIPAEERAHYAKRQVDIKYRFPFGWKEIEGIHNRGNWDLTTHSKHSGQQLTYKEGDEEFYPWIVETSVGMQRAFFAFLVEFFTQQKGGRSETTQSTKEEEVVMKFPYNIAPISVAVFPLVKNKPQLVEKARQVYNQINPHIPCRYDEVGSIGRRYRRADEIGVPYAVTIDYNSLEDGKVTVRDRDTMKQERVEIDKLVSYLKGKL